MPDSAETLRVRALDPAALLSAALRQRYVVAVSIAIAVAAAVIVTLQRPRTYTARMAIKPAGQRAALPDGGTGLSMLVGGTTATPELDYYVDLLESRTVLEEVAGSRFTLGAPPGAREVPLSVALELPTAHSAALNLERGITHLRDLVSVSADPRTGIVRAFVRTESPQVSVQLVDRLVAAMGRLDMRVRTTAAEQERVFYAGQKAAVARELQHAENELQRFRQHNVGEFRSPALFMEESRLMQNAENQRARVVELEQQEFQARLQAARSAPSFSVIEPATAPAIANSRGLLTNLAFAVTLGLVMGLYTAFLKERIVARRGRTT